jgi:hypothetical protein
MEDPGGIKKCKRLLNVMIIVCNGVFVISFVIQWYFKGGFMLLPTIFFGGMAFACIVARLLMNKNILLGN